MFPVAPVLHDIVPPMQPVAVKVASSPSQQIVRSVVIEGFVGAGNKSTFTELEASDVPQIVVHVAVYVPAPTSFVSPVPPADHVIVPPVHPVAVNVALSVPHTSVLFEDMLGAAGFAPVLIVMVFDASDVPQVVVHMAVYVPAPTSFVRPVPPADHVIVPPVHPVAVNVALSVPHTSVLFEDMLGAAGFAPVLIDTELDATDVPQVVVHVAVYVPAPTSFVSPVPPADHVIVPPVHPVAVSVAFSVPHTSVLLEDMLGATGDGPFSITILFEFPDFPQKFSQYAVYVPSPTLILAVVAPVLHLSVPVAHALAVNVALSVPQITNGPPVIVGAVGLLNFSIVIGVELSLTPQLVVHVAV
jgi:hypothetical protein